MSKFEQAGFLADDVNEIMANVRSRYADELALLCEINDFAQSLNKQLTVVPGRPDTLLAAALHARVLYFFQAYVITVERGMIVPAHHLLRRMLESVFALVAVNRSPGFARRFILAEQLHRFERLKTLLTFAGEAAADAVDPVAARQFIARFTEDHGDVAVKPLSVEEIAKAAGMQDWYATAYTVLADTVYSTPHSIEAALLQSGVDEAAQFTYGPALEGLTISLSAAANNLLNAIAAVSEVFAIGCTDQLREMRARIDALEHRTS